MLPKVHTIYYGILASADCRRNAIPARACVYAQRWIGIQMHVRGPSNVSILGYRGFTASHHLNDSHCAFPANGNLGHGKDLYDVYEGDNAHVYRWPDHRSGGRIL